MRGSVLNVHVSYRKLKTNVIFKFMIIMVVIRISTTTIMTVLFLRIITLKFRYTFVMLKFMYLYILHVHAFKKFKVSYLWLTTFAFMLLVICFIIWLTIKYTVSTVNNLHCFVVTNSTQCQDGTKSAILDNKTQHTL